MFNLRLGCPPAPPTRAGGVRSASGACRPSRVRPGGASSPSTVRRWAPSMRWRRSLAPGRSATPRLRPRRLSPSPSCTRMRSPRGSRPTAPMSRACFPNVPTSTEPRPGICLTVTPDLGMSSRVRSTKLSGTSCLFGPPCSDRPGKPRTGRPRSRSTRRRWRSRGVPPMSALALPPVVVARVCSSTLWSARSTVRGENRVV